MKDYAATRRMGFQYRRSCLLAIGLELILSSHRGVVKGTVLSELICAGLNARSVTSRSLETAFGAIVDHGEKGSVFRIDPYICS
jgi:hypothetical protein